jgi:hypothetical protein
MMRAMNSDFQAAQLFEQVRNSDEHVVWAGRPSLIPFLASGIPFLIVGVIWFCIDFFGFIRPMFLHQGAMPSSFTGFAVPFFALHLAPFWLSIANIGRLAFVFNNTAYALTDRRLLFRTGFWGIDYDSIDLDQITDVQVNVGPIENALGVGSISINAGRTTSKGAILRQTFVAIPEPYELFKEVKKVSLDIKSDLEYPNKLRPADNPGYKTTYSGQ